MDDAVPPCPERLKSAFRDAPPAGPARIPRSQFDTIPLGSIWEVKAPDGEILLFVVTEDLGKPEELSFGVLRAVPLSEHITLAAQGDAIVTTEPSPEVFVGHCWLEGPVCDYDFIACVGTATKESMAEVRAARKIDLPPWEVPDAAISAYRHSLYQQVDPVYSACWNALYSSIGE